MPSVLKICSDERNYFGKIGERVAANNAPPNHVTCREVSMAAEYSTRPKEGVAERFYKYTFPCPMSGCWLWGGGTIKAEYKRYGKISGKLAHRLSYEMHIGPIPNGMFVCHHCDTPLCVNPAHLYAGTHMDNMRDVRVRNRSKRPRIAPKLSDDGVREIRNYRPQKGEAFVKMFCKKYGIGKTYVHEIRDGTSRKYVKDA